MESEPPKSQILDKDKTEELMKFYSSRQPDWSQTGNDKYFFPYAYSEHAESIWRMKVRPTDRWVVTFPRSGTTWTQELSWLLNNDLNYEEAAKKTISERFTFLDLAFFNRPNVRKVDGKKLGIGGIVKEQEILPVGESLDSMASPRFIKTHLPIELLPSGLLDAGCKVVYVARNPKDVIVSYYHLKSSQNMMKYIGDFASFWNFFQKDMKLCCPYWSHVKEAWGLRHHPNLLFLFYEEMKMDLAGVIRKASEFYGRPCTDNEVAGLVEHLSFENFKKNPMIRYCISDGHRVVSDVNFARKGKIGGWKELFTPELEAQADKWIEENLRDTDLVFPYVQLTLAVEQ